MLFLKYSRVLQKPKCCVIVRLQMCVVRIRGRTKIKYQVIKDDISVLMISVLIWL